MKNINTEKHIQIQTKAKNFSQFVSVMCVINQNQETKRQIKIIKFQIQINFKKIHEIHLLI